MLRCVECFGDDVLHKTLSGGMPECRNCAAPAYHLTQEQISSAKKVAGNEPWYFSGPWRDSNEYIRMTVNVQYDGCSKAVHYVIRDDGTVSQLVAVGGPGERILGEWNQ